MSDLPEFLDMKTFDKLALEYALLHATEPKYRYLTRRRSGNRSPRGSLRRSLRKSLRKSLRRSQRRSRRKSQRKSKRRSRRKSNFGFSNGKWVIFTKNGCPYCEKAVELLKSKGLPYVALEGSENTDKMQEMMGSTVWNTWPKIFKPDGKFLGGYQKLLEEKDL